MERTVTVTTEASPARLFEVVADLGTYADWLDIVSSVESAESHPDFLGPAWFITLRAQMGRFARSKRLRIVRVGSTAGPDPDSGDGATATFARFERDGRDHANWDMTATVTSAAEGSQLGLELAYSGGLWSSVLDALLGDEVEQALERLPAYALAERGESG